MDSFSTPILRRRLDEVAATQSPTEAFTEPTGTNIQNRNGVETESLLTMGEKIGAVIGGSVTFLIAIYFVVLFVQARQFLKRQEEQRKRRKTYAAERRRRRKNLIPGWKKHTERIGNKTPLRDSNHQEDGTCHSTMDEYSNYEHHSGDDYTKTSDMDIEMSSAYTRSVDGDSDDDSTHKSGTSKADSHKWTENAHSVTRRFLKALSSKESKNDGGEDDYKTNYYVQHQDEIEDDGESINTTISSPFHPSPSPKIESENANTTTYVLKHEIEIAGDDDKEKICTAHSTLLNVVAVDDMPFDCQYDDKPFGSIE